MPVKPPHANGRSAGDRRVVMTIVGLFAVGAVVLMSMNVADSARNSRAKEAIGQTFVRMHSRQSEFRSMNRRFATWTELQAGGAELGPRQSVVDSNADASHWFLSIRDGETGIICDRTGELTDEGPATRPPMCRELKTD